MSGTFSKWFGLKHGEARPTLEMYTYLMMAVGAFMFARIARDSLFLSRYDISYLPYMYVWVAIGVAAASYVYSHFADGMRRDRLIQLVTILLLAGVIASRILLMFAGDWFLPVLYVFVEIMGGLLTIQFWTLANDIFTTRQAKRIFGIIGAGGITATIITGFTVGELTQVIGTDNLFWICAVLLLGCLIMVIRQGKIHRRELALAMTGVKPSHGIHLSQDLSRVFSSKHLKTIAWITVITFVVVTIVDFQFKVIARYSFLNREDELSEFFGWFYSFAAIGSLIIQLLVTGKMLQRFGIIASLMLLPIALSAGSILLLIVPGLLTVSILKGADTVLRYSVNDAGTQVLYLPVASNIRGRAKAFITGVIKPLSQGACGLVLAWGGVLVGHRVDWLAGGSLLALAGLMLLVLGLKNDYLQSLLSTLRERKLNLGDSPLSLTDSQTVSALEQTLGDEDERSILHALEMVPYVRRHDWTRELRKLLQHPSTEVRFHALKLLGAENPSANLDLILDMLNDKSDDVRSEAIRVYCSVLKEKAMGAIEPLLEQNSVKVRAAALIGLIRYGGLEGIISAAQSLQSMLTSDDPASRKAGAWAIGQVRVRTFYRSLLPLLEDPDVQVRLAALDAASYLRSPELVLSLINRLSDPKTKKSAIKALAAYGPSLLVTLRTVLDNPREERKIRLVIPEVLARVHVQLSMDILSNSLETDDTEFRQVVISAIGKLAKRSPDLRLDREMLRRVLHRELKRTYQLVVTKDDLSSIYSPLLHDAIKDRIDSSMARIFSLLHLLFPERYLEIIERNLLLQNTSIRSNAVELLENMLDHETKQCLVPLVEEDDPHKLSEIGDQLFPLLHRSPIGWLHELLMDENDWIVATTIETIRKLKDPAFGPSIRMIMKHRSSIVRETAAFCIKEISSEMELAVNLKPLAKDPDEAVRKAVTCLCPNLATD